MKKETTRQSIIRLMKGCEETFNRRDSKELASILYADLISEGYLEGVTNRNEQGIPNANRIINITLKGRVYLEELEKVEREKSWLAKVKKYGGSFLLWLLGIATPMIVEVLKKIFK